MREIVSLRWWDMEENGSRIEVRTKTDAATERRLVKKVSDWGYIRPTEILIRRRREAVQAGRELLFVGPRWGKSLVASNMTHMLRALIKKMGWLRRISSHNARRGGAVVGIMAGLPLQVIQAFGAWKSADTLQIYIAKAIRNGCCFLDMLEKTP